MASGGDHVLARLSGMTFLGWPRPPASHRELARPDKERLTTPATVLTFGRTAAALVLSLWGAHDGSLTLLLWGLGVYWVGDIADGVVARRFDHETRIGAVLDIMCDRLCAATFYVGFAWYDPSMVVPVAIYLAEFLVIDMFLSTAFLAWPLSSPNYFYVVDNRLWRWNWSKPGKAVNSALFAVLMVVTRDAMLAGVIAASLFVMKTVSLGWLMRLGLPVPSAAEQPPTIKPHHASMPAHAKESR